MITSSDKRNVALDALRFVGVSLTLFRHVNIAPGDNLTLSFLHVMKRGGWIGVDLFFVLSGFLVSGLIFREIAKYSTFSVKTFLIRRGFKIYPSYYIFLFLMVAIYFFKPHLKITTLGFVSEACFINNYFKFDHPWLWSIAVEEHFYLIVACLLFALHAYGKLKAETMLFLYFLFLVIALSFRLQNFLGDFPFDWFRFMAKSHLRFDSLFFGVLLSYFYHFKPDSLSFIYRNKLTLLTISLLYLSTNFVWPISDYGWVSLFSLSLNPVFFGIIMLLSIDRKNLSTNFFVKKCAYLGKYSYSIYLFHGAVFFFFSNRFGYWQDLVGYFIISFAFGIAFSKIIEYPFLKIRDFYFPSRSGT